MFFVELFKVKKNLIPQRHLCHLCFINRINASSEAQNVIVAFPTCIGSIWFMNTFFHKH